MAAPALSLFNGEAEYDSIRAVAKKVSPFRLSRMATLLTRHKARAVPDHTGADALMIGRAAQEINLPRSFGKSSII